MPSGHLLLIKINFFIILNVYYQTHIPLNNLTKLALGPSLIKYNNDSMQILKNENTKQLDSRFGDTKPYQYAYNNV